MLRKPVPCTPEFGSKKGKHVRVYRHSTLTYPDGKGGKIVSDVSDRSGYATASHPHGSTPGRRRRRPGRRPG